MAVMGGIIGAGIFINPYLVAERLDTSFLIVSVWISGGVVTCGPWCGGSALSLGFGSFGAERSQAGDHRAEQAVQSRHSASRNTDKVTHAGSGSRPDRAS